MNNVPGKLNKCIIIYASDLQGSTYRTLVNIDQTVVLIEFEDRRFKH